jgi:hypothetical protein
MSDDGVSWIIRPSAVCIGHVVYHSDFLVVFISIQQALMTTIEYHVLSDKVLDRILTYLVFDAPPLAVTDFSIDFYLDVSVSLRSELGSILFSVR